MEPTQPTFDLSRFQLAQRIIQALGIRRMLAVSRVEQIVEVLGADQALAFLDETLHIEMRGSEQQGQDLRHKMPGGIFFTLVREHLRRNRRHSELHTIFGPTDLSTELPISVHIGETFTSTVRGPTGDQEREWELVPPQLPDWQWCFWSRHKRTFTVGEAVSVWVKDIDLGRHCITLTVDDFGRVPWSESMRERYLNALADMERTLDEAEQGSITLPVPANLSEFRGMLGRCVKQDQPDWLLVFQALGFRHVTQARSLYHLIIELQRAIKAQESEPALVRILSALQDYGLLDTIRHAQRIIPTITPRPARTNRNVVADDVGTATAPDNDVNAPTNPPSLDMVAPEVSEQSVDDGRGLVSVADDASLPKWSISAPNLEQRPARAAWSRGESTWHRTTVALLADEPNLLGSLVVAYGPIVRTWHDSTIARDGKRLWNRLLTRRHPDVVFEHHDGSLTIVEVEPYPTILDGIGQIIGDYVLHFLVDRRASQLSVDIRGLLVTDIAGSRLALQWRTLLQQHGVMYVVFDAALRQIVADRPPS
jgi:hypothetical protein